MATNLSAEMEAQRDLIARAMMAQALQNAALDRGVGGRQSGDFGPDTGYVADTIGRIPPFANVPDWERSKPQPIPPDEPRDIPVPTPRPSVPEPPRDIPIPTPRPSVPEDVPA